MATGGLGILGEGHMAPVPIFIRQWRHEMARPSLQITQKFTRNLKWRIKSDITKGSVERIPFPPTLIFQNLITLSTVAKGMADEL